MTIAALSLQLVLTASSYGYDSLGRLSSVSAPWGVTGVTWEPGGQRLKTLGAESFDYDGRGWLSSVTTPQGVRTYTYDGRGNRLTETMTGGTIQTRHFSYDSADRLVATQEWDGHIEAWALRADGAKQQEKQWAAGTTFSQPFDFATPNPVVTKNYTYRTDGTLAAVTNAVSGVVEVGYVHDNNGHVTQRTVGGISTTYGWDVDGRLVTANSSGPGLPTLAATYDYDGLGMRRRAQVSITPINGPPVSTIRTWTWGGSDGEDEVQEDGKVTTHVAGFRVGDGINVFSHDGIGSVVAQDDGANTNEAQFSAWGTRTALGTNFGPLASSAGFTGHRVEEALGLVSAEQRWLDPLTGTWMSRDPVGAASYLQSPNELNPWQYAASSPTRYTDPDGRAPPQARPPSGLGGPGQVIRGPSTTIRLGPNTPRSPTQNVPLRAGSGPGVGEAPENPNESPSWIRWRRPDEESELPRSLNDYVGIGLGDPACPAGCMYADDGVPLATKRLMSRPSVSNPGTGSQAPMVDPLVRLPMEFPTAPENWGKEIVEPIFNDPMLFPGAPSELVEEMILGSRNWRQSSYWQTQEQYIYIGHDGYIGITDNLGRRTTQWLDKGRTIVPLAAVRGRLAARGIEQMLIEIAQDLGLPGSMNTWMGRANSGPQVNSISPERVPGAANYSKDSIDKAMEMRERGVEEFERVRDQMLRRLESQEAQTRMDPNVRAAMRKALKGYLK